MISRSHILVLHARCFSACVLVILVAAVVGLRGRGASQPAGFCGASQPAGLAGSPLHTPLLSALLFRLQDVFQQLLGGTCAAAPRAGGLRRSAAPEGKKGPARERRGGRRGREEAEDGGKERGTAEREQRLECSYCHFHCGSECDDDDDEDSGDDGGDDDAGQASEIQGLLIRLA